MPTLKSRLGDWQLEHVHAWSERQLVIRAEPIRVVEPSTKVATIGSCFAAELAAVMGEVGIVGGMHPSGLFYSTAAIRQEFERIAGGWPELSAEPSWHVGEGWVDPFRDYDTQYPDEDALRASRVEAEAAADALFRDAKVIVITLGLIETWRSATTGNTFRQIPHPAVFPSLGAQFHRLTVAEMLDDLERIRDVVTGQFGATLIVTTSPVPLHTTFTQHDVRVANNESKSRIRAAVSEFVDRHPDVHYFHSYEMVVTAERQSDFFRDDGRHVHRHAVRYIMSEFLRLFASPELSLGDVDTSWLTAITKTATVPGPRERREPPREPSAPRPRVSFARRVVRGVRRRAKALVRRAPASKA